MFYLLMLYIDSCRSQMSSTSLTSQPVLPLLHTGSLIFIFYYFYFKDGVNGDNQVWSAKYPQQTVDMPTKPCHTPSPPLSKQPQTFRVDTTNMFLPSHLRKPVALLSISCVSPVWLRHTRMLLSCTTTPPPFYSVHHLPVYTQHWPAENGVVLRTSALGCSSLGKTLLPFNSVGVMWLSKGNREKWKVRKVVRKSPFSSVRNGSFVGGKRPLTDVSLRYCKALS